MASKRYFQEFRTFSCPIKNAVHLLGDKWILFILREFLEDEVFGFNELHSKLGGISTRTLTLKLDLLEKQHIVEKKVLRFKPRKVEYKLTSKGHGFLPLLQEMGVWFREHYGRVRENL